MSKIRLSPHPNTSDGCSWDPTLGLSTSIPGKARDLSKLCPSCPQVLCSAHSWSIVAHTLNWGEWLPQGASGPVAAVVGQRLGTGWQARHQLHLWPCFYLPVNHVLYLANHITWLQKTFVKVYECRRGVPVWSAGAGDVRGGCQKPCQAGDLLQTTARL